MTNEELATKIRGGERELLPTLWAGVQAFARLQAARWLRAWQPSRPGLEFEDLYQCGWPALCAACETFSADDGGKFVGWFKLYLLTEFATEIGVRSPKQAKDPLNNRPTSLDAPLGGDTENLTLSDVVPDPEDQLSAIENDIYLDQLHDVLEDALSRLSIKEQEAVKAIFIDGEPMRAVAKRIGSSVETVRQHRNHALRAMRRNNGRALRDLLDGTSSAYYGSGLKSWQQSGLSVQERLLIRADSGKPD